MDGWAAEKEADRKTVFSQAVLENQYNLLTRFYFIELTKRKKNLLLKKFWPDFGGGHNQEVDEVC